MPDKQAGTKDVPTSFADLRPISEEEEMIKLFRDKAEKGNAGAAYQLGNVYYEGLLREERNKEEAFRFYRMAALLGHDEAKKKVAEYDRDLEKEKEDERLRESAKEAFRERKYSRSEELWNKVLQKAPCDVEAIEALKEIEAEKNRIAASKSFFVEVCGIIPWSGSKLYLKSSGVTQIAAKKIKLKT